MDDYTADAWHDVLSLEPWLTLGDARAAVIEVKRRQPFVDVSEVIAEAKKTRGRRNAIERDEQLLTPLRRARLADPRPAREEIDAIVARFGLRALPAAAPSADVSHPPAHVQHAQLDQWERDQAVSGDA